MREVHIYLHIEIDHVCEISTTVCLDYQTDDGKPWVIWVDNSKNWVDHDVTLTMQQETQGIPNRQRESTPISLEVGDVLVYQGGKQCCTLERLLDR